MKFALKLKTNKDKSTEIFHPSSLNQLIYVHVQCRKPKKLYAVVVVKQGPI